MFSENKQAIPSSCFLAYAVHDPPSPFPEDFAVELSDGPIFNKDLILIGYFVAIPSNKTLSLDSDEIENVAHTIETNCKRIMEGDKNLKIMCLSSSEITKYYDIIATLWSSTLFAVAISVADHRETRKGRTMTNAAQKPDIAHSVVSRARGAFRTSYTAA
nr:CRE-PTD-2 protein [Haemonchus contortus]